MPCRSRLDALRSALDHACVHEGVWPAAGAEITDHYLAWTRTEEDGP